MHSNLMSDVCVKFGQKPRRLIQLINIRNNFRETSAPNLVLFQRSDDKKIILPYTKSYKFINIEYLSHVFQLICIIIKQLVLIISLINF